MNSHWITPPVASPNASPNPRLVEATDVQLGNEVDLQGSIWKIMDIVAALMNRWWTISNWGIVMMIILTGA